MADSSVTSETKSQNSSSALQALRALAQSHLTDIEIENAAEASQQESGQRDLQKYIRVKRKDRVKEQISPPPEVKGSRFRSAPDVLDRLRHDPMLNLAEYRIGYLERFEGIREMAAQSWIKESTDEDWIPQHRIRYIKRVSADGVQEVVWDRDERIDKVFGSGSGGGNMPSGSIAGEEDDSEFGGVVLS